jgi:KilA-N domain
MAAHTAKIYSATYSNVPVYEYNVSPGNHVMRRRADDWINATHILKVAAYDKPARTRILEREVQKGVHEKVQGGYGKYQGTRCVALKRKDWCKLIMSVCKQGPGSRFTMVAPWPSATVS